MRQARKRTSIVTFRMTLPFSIGVLQLRRAAWLLIAFLDTLSIPSNILRLIGSSTG
jgi:hypothetical protein